MSEQIKPALTAEEWERLAPEPTKIDVAVGRIVVSGTRKPGVMGVPALSFHPVEDRHGIAACCLYGQPFGFTGEDVRLLAGEVGDLLHRSGSEEARADYVRRAEALTGLYERIAALLPETS